LWWGCGLIGDAWPLAQAQSRIWTISSREALERPALALLVRRLLGPAGDGDAGLEGWRALTILSAAIEDIHRCGCEAPARCMLRLVDRGWHDWHRRCVVTGDP
jgi:hypothetical protein